MLEKFKLWRERKPLFTHDADFFNEVYNEAPTYFKRDILLELVSLAITCKKLNDRIDELEKQEEELDD